MRLVDGKNEDFMGFSVYNGTRDSLINKIKQDLLTGNKNIIIAVNPKKIVLSKKSSEAASAFHAATVHIADGVGIVIGARKFGIHIKERITGIDLLEGILRKIAPMKIPIFFFGASEENLVRAVDNIKSTYKEINIVGQCNGYIEEKSKVVEQIRNSRAEVLVVALGSPAQEIFVKEYCNELKNVKLILTVGGSIDVLSKRVKRAPKLICKMNIEWLYRMISQPKRIIENRFLLEYISLLLREIRRRGSRNNDC
ncbi:MAG: WecB/TagA/CpsF family glycosyltransferase [Clostridiales bacterium]|nr:WecB/TagA/CpsF family glycosyltransferase [Clostridiales bacterium]